MQIELDLDSPARKDRPARFPWGVLVAVLLLAAVLYLRQPVPAAASSTDSGSASPPAPLLALSAGAVESYSIDPDGHTFGMSFFITSSSTWPITVTGIRMILPIALAESVPSRLVSANPGRGLPSTTFAIQLTRSSPVLVVVGLSVRCDQLYTAVFGQVRVLATVNVAGQVSAVDIANRYVMNGWPWSSALAAQACGQELGPPPLTSNRVFGSDLYGGAIPLGVFGPFGGSGPLIVTNPVSSGGSMRRR
jgi:hypothetical protein